MSKFYTIRHKITGLHLNHDGSGTQDINEMKDFHTRAAARQFKKGLLNTKQYRVTQWIMRSV